MSKTKPKAPKRKDVELSLEKTRHYVALAQTNQTS